VSAEQPAVGDSGGNGASQPQASPAAQPQALAPDGRLIVYTGSMVLEVAELRPAIDQAQGIVVGVGGHLAGSSLESSADRGEYATVTYRIPAARWSEALQTLRALGARVVNESTDSEDVSEQVVDLDARISNLQVTEAAFQTFMERATTIDEVLKVQAELTTVRGEIERLTAQRDTLSDRAALGTLSVTFQVPIVETSRASDGWDLGREVDNAIATLVRFGQGLTSLGVWLLIVVVPVLVPVLVLGYAALHLRRRWLAQHPTPQPVYAVSGAPGAPGTPAAPSVPAPGPWKQDG
jgi:hypothetical protein